METTYIQYIVFFGPLTSLRWKKIPARRLSKKVVYKTHPHSYNAAPFPEGVKGDEGARLQDFDSLGLSPAPITEEQFGANPCPPVTTFRKISGIRSVFTPIATKIGSGCPLPCVSFAAP